MKKISRMREYMKHVPKLRDKIKIIIAWLVVVGVPIKYERIRMKLRKIFGIWMRKREIMVDNCIYKLVDLDSAYIVNPAYEDTMKDYFNPKVGETLVDVGAHIGKYTIFFAKKGVNVIAVEPSPEVFDVLQKNIQINGVMNRVTSLNVAAWSEKTEVCLNGNQVKTISLDELIDKGHIDWIKIDVDGKEREREREVFRGLKRVLSTQSPKVISELREETKGEILSFLRGLGYNSKFIYGYGTPGTEDIEDMYYYSEKKEIVATK